MLIVLLLLLAAVAAAALALLWLVVRGHNKRLLLAGSHAVASDTPGGIGISVLCSGVHAQEQVENLLSAEYAHYEVIVVLDSLRYPVEFAAFTARYRMIRVEYALSEELPVTGVRALGRSRKRRFRRLVLVDRAQDTPAGDFDAAAEVAAYDYVLPVREGQFLLPDAVVRLVAEVGARGVGGCDCVRARIGEPAVLLSREAVVAAGGFARRPAKPFRGAGGGAFGSRFSIRPSLRAGSVLVCRQFCVSCRLRRWPLRSSPPYGRPVAGGLPCCSPQPSCGASPDVFRWPLAILPAGVRAAARRGCCAAVK